MSKVDELRKQMNELDDRREELYFEIQKELETERKNCEEEMMNKINLIKDKYIGKFIKCIEKDEICTGVVTDIKPDINGIYVVCKSMCRFTNMIVTYEENFKVLDDDVELITEDEAREIMHKQLDNIFDNKILG